jgi:hypothetical protein
MAFQQSPQISDRTMSEAARIAKENVATTEVNILYELRSKLPTTEEAAKVILHALVQKRVVERNVAPNGHVTIWGRGDKQSPIGWQGQMILRNPKRWWAHE